MSISQFCDEQWVYGYSMPSKFITGKQLIGSLNATTGITEASVTFTNPDNVMMPGTCNQFLYKTTDCAALITDAATDCSAELPENPALVWTEHTVGDGITSYSSLKISFNV